MRAETAWVKPPYQSGGLDHLAVQAPCINIYGRLLPGITNVSDRARYYSFYPWLIWAFDQRGWRDFDDHFVERFRRADCLFTLIALRHAEVSEGDYEDHAGAMVGSNTLRPALRELLEHGSLRLSSHSRRDNTPERYFANKMGGLGQYYLGVLRELGILDGDAARGFKYTLQIGLPLAERADTTFDHRLFLDLVEADILTTDELDLLSDLCPCQLEKNSEEQKMLQDLFFAQGEFGNTEALPRRRSLQSILHLGEQLAKDSKALDENSFRACSYSGAIPSGKPWHCPDSLAINRNRWRIYVRNELLSVTVQGLFFAVLDAYEESGLRLTSSAEIIRWFVRQGDVQNTVNAFGKNGAFDNLVKESASWLPSLINWTERGHEIQLTERIVTLCNGHRSTQARLDILRLAMHSLIAFEARRRSGSWGYGDLTFEPWYFQYYPINLNSFAYHSSNTWASRTLAETLEWILLEWGIETHLRVAMRKLRGHSQSTFRIRPSDRGFEVIAVPPAVYTSPRFSQALRILKDVGALTKSSSGKLEPSDFGRRIIDQNNAQ